MASIGFINSLLLLGGLLVLAGIFSSFIATRVGAPLLLVFLVVGMLAGEDGPGGISFDDYSFAYLVGSLALAVILFDGGLRTRFARFRTALWPAATLATAGVLVTAGLTAAVALLLFDFTFVEALLLGAIVGSTDAAAVFFLLHTGGLQLKPRISATLEIESGTNDPMAMFLTLLLVEALLAGEGAWSSDMIGTFIQQMAVGAMLGAGGGAAGVALLNRIDMAPGLHPLFIVAAALTIYALTSLAGGSGFLAVYLAGLIVGNRATRAFASIMSFHDAATWLCQIAMFLILGLLVTPSRLLDYALPALAIAAFLILVARPVAVWLCLAPFRFGNLEKTFVSWVGLRGAVSIFLAAIPMLSGLPHAEIYFNVAFFVVLVSLLVQGWTVNAAARRLGMAQTNSAPQIRRVELDLPGQLAYEMVGYPIVPDSPILAKGDLPTGTRPLLVVREGEVLGPGEAGAFRPGDYAYFLAPPDRIGRLDRLFGAPGDGGPETARFGTLPFGGDVSLGDIARLYDLDLPADLRERTLSELFAERYRDKVHGGDRLTLGRMRLIVREVRDGRVVRADLQLGFRLVGTLAPGARLPRLVQRVLRRWERLRRRGEAGAGGSGKAPPPPQSDAD